MRFFTIHLSRQKIYDLKFLGVLVENCVMSICVLGEFVPGILCFLTFGIFRRELVYKGLPQNSPHIYFFRVVITFPMSFFVFFEYAENNSNSQQFTTT
jgi:hypothetical protein